MNKPMTPSAQEMTDGQINKVTDLLQSALRKHRGELDTNAVQQALGAKGLATDLLAVFRGHVEFFSNMIIRTVIVNRDQTPEQALIATGRKQYTDNNVVAAMPKGTGKEVKVVFFKVGCYIGDDDLEKEYESRGLKPVDPFSLASVNEVDPAFADEHPNATHWKDSGGKWCYAAFRRWNGGERDVDVRRHGFGWGDGWWFAGLAS